VTAVAEALDLDALLALPSAGGSGGRGCEGVDDDPCGNQAVTRVIWKTRCPCAAGEILLCAAHTGWLRDRVRDGMIFACTTCLRAVFIIRIEPLR
jgi:hypothetical protein